MHASVCVSLSAHDSLAVCRSFVALSFCTSACFCAFAVVVFFFLSCLTCSSVFLCVVARFPLLHRRPRHLPPPPRPPLCAFYVTSPLVSLLVAAVFSLPLCLSVFLCIAISPSPCVDTFLLSFLCVADFSFACARVTVRPHFPCLISPIPSAFPLSLAHLHPH